MIEMCIVEGSAWSVMGQVNKLLAEEWKLYTAAPAGWRSKIVGPTSQPREVSEAIHVVYLTRERAYP